MKGKYNLDGRTFFPCGLHLRIKFFDEMRPSNHNCEICSNTRFTHTNLIYHSIHLMKSLMNCILHQKKLIERLKIMGN